MTEMTQTVASGHYARKQLRGRAWLMSWSHRRRFALAQRLAGAIATSASSITAAAMAHSWRAACGSPNSPSQAVGAEITASLVEDCRSRLAALDRLSFVAVNELDGLERFDAVVCMEVLEHVVDWNPVFALWDRLLVPGGELLISVPNETGPALAVKQAARRIAGWLGIGDYPGIAPYTWAEFWRGIWAGRRQHCPPPCIARRMARCFIATRVSTGAFSAISSASAGSCCRCFVRPRRCCPSLATVKFGFCCVSHLDAPPGNCHESYTSKSSPGSSARSRLAGSSCTICSTAFCREALAHGFSVSARRDMPGSICSSS